MASDSGSPVEDSHAPTGSTSKIVADKQTTHFSKSNNTDTSSEQMAADHKIKIESYEKELADLKNQISGLSTELRHYKSSAASASTNQSTQLTTAKSELDSANRKIQELTTNANENQLKVAHLQRKGEQLAAELSAKTTLIDQLKEQQQLDLTQPSPEQESSRLPIPLFRKWTGQNGREVEMAFIKRDANGQLIFIGTDNIPFSVAPSHLTPEDLKLIESAIQ